MADDAHQRKTLASVIERLDENGLLEPVAETQSAGREQQRQFERLMKRAEHASSTQSYLAAYDACLRLVEMILILHGFVLGEQPHSSARQVIAVVSPKADFHSLSKIRHDAKKRSIPPPAGAQTRLNDLIEQLVDATNRMKS